MEGNTVMASGVIGPESMTTSYGREEFYVDPRDGTLRKTKKRPRYRQEKKLNNDSYFDPKKPLLQYHKIGEVWYEFKFREATAEEKSQKSFGYMSQDFSNLTMKCEWKWRPLHGDKFVSQIIDGKKIGPHHYYRHDRLWSVCQSLFGGAYLPIEKRQISSKDVRKVEEMIKERNRKLSRKAA